MLLLKRTVSRDKPPKITVNGSLATLAALAAARRSTGSTSTVPSEPRRLLQEACQLELLDLFGRAGAALAAYQDNTGAWRERLRPSGRGWPPRGQLAPEQIEFL